MSRRGAPPASEAESQRRCAVMNGIEPPYGVIWSRWRQGKVIPFLGAGASLVGRPADKKWDADNPTFLPSGLELAHYLADETAFPSIDDSDRGNLAKVSSYYADLNGRVLLCEQLRTVFNRPYVSS